MNDVRLSGKVLNAYYNDDGFLTVTISVVHDHVVNGYNHVVESIIRGFLPDKERSRELDITPDDRVNIAGYLKQDITLSKGGNEHRRINLYISKIEKVK